ncbi:FecCD family ABC transporter permease [Paludibacterium paludis]|uniref:Iron complex transport system permease protein n=1 Tax=Paludibacterium paludis TaxID=1225769 RepID=A0A918UBX1_9NEIS|nr:iron ABC transporter permease [Paludibacterium paludis]GGY25678.1 hypothetical protein GCM10011289_31640 [Paludibacterium paludis]
MIRLGLIILAVAFVTLLCLGIGAGQWIPPDRYDPLVTELRLPRALAALLTGAALAAAGSALQALFGNRLADPGLIGTSGGAALGVIGSMALGLGGAFLPVAAFAGGLGVTLLVLALNRLMRGGLSGLLILGIAVSAFCGAAVSLILFLSDDMALRSAMTWLSGSLSEARYGLLPGALSVMLPGLALLVFLARDLDILTLGEDSASSLGIRVGRVRFATAVSAALLAGAAVSLSGIIGFVGMMVPNAVSLVLRGSRRQVIAASSLAGAVFLLVVDTAGRSVAYPVDLPAGLIAGFAGPPFFFWLFYRQRGLEHA